jgi:hypothetical protein
MLTKEERAAIAERAASFNGDSLHYTDIYRCLFGEDVPSDTTIKEDDKNILDRLIDLCDTSNMLELPRDKDGEIIHIHDVVYDNTGMEWEVSEFRFPFDGACIYARTDNDYSTFRPDELTHKVTTIEENIEEFNKAVKATAQYVEASMNKCVEAMKKLAEVFNSLGDNDD